MRTGPLVRLAALRMRQGRLEEAERLLEGIESRTAARQVLATIALARGELALAEDPTRLCLEGEVTSTAACVPLLELLLDVQLAHEDLDAAAGTVARISAVAQRSEGDHTRAAAQLAAGRLAAALGEERPRSHLQAAIDAFSELQLPLEAARAQLQLARALAPEAPADAVAEGRAALATFERLGAAREADAAAGLLRTLGESGGRAWPKGAGELTRREREVLALLAQGCSNTDIASRLYISRRTAEHHVASVLSKLGLRRRAEAAAYAARERAEYR